MSQKDVKKVKKDESEVTVSTSDTHDDLLKEIEALKIAKEELEKKYQEQQSKILRLHADIDNLHKQYSLEVSQAKKSGKKLLITPVIDLLNTINLSFAFVPLDADEAFKKFVESLRSSLLKAQGDLESIGVSLVVPAIDDDFDPNTMQALNSSDDAKVKQVVSIGYKVDGVLIAPAVVMI